MKRIGLGIGVLVGLAGHSVLIGLDYVLCRLFFWKKNVIFACYNFLNSRLLLALFGKDRIRAFNNLAISGRVQSFLLPPDTPFEVTVQLKNISDRMIRIPPNSISFFGQEGPLRLGTSHPRDRDSVFYCDRWESRNRILSFGEIVLKEQESIPLTCTLKTPPSVGTYHESFGLVYESFMWLNDQCVVEVDVEVVPASRG